MWDKIWRILVILLLFGGVLVGVLSIREQVQRKIAKGPYCWICEANISRMKVMPYIKAKVDGYGSKFNQWQMAALEDGTKIWLCKRCFSVVQFLARVEQGKLMKKGCEVLDGDIRDRMNEIARNRRLW